MEQVKSSPHCMRVSHLGLRRATRQDQDSITQDVSLNLHTCIARHLPRPVSLTHHTNACKACLFLLNRRNIAQCQAKSSILCGLQHMNLSLGESYVKAWASLHSRATHFHKDSGAIRIGPRHRKLSSLSCTLFIDSNEGRCSGPATLSPSGSVASTSTH